MSSFSNLTHDEYSRYNRRGILFETGYLCNEYEIFDIRSAFFTHSLPSSIGEDVWATISARFTMIRGPIDFVLQRENRRVWPARVQTRPFSIFSRCGAREPERTVLAPLHLRTIFL